MHEHFSIGASEVRISWWLIPIIWVMHFFVLVAKFVKSHPGVVTWVAFAIAGVCVLMGIIYENQASLFGETALVFLGVHLYFLRKGARKKLTT